jgi:hypothetical protein
LERREGKGREGLSQAWVEYGWQARLGRRIEARVNCCEYACRGLDSGKPVETVRLLVEEPVWSLNP